MAGLQANTLGDGLFHGRTYAATLLGLWLLWRSAPDAPGVRPGRLLGELLLIGWGGFNLVEGSIDHQLLELHDVREHSALQGAWDLAFLVWEGQQCCSADGDLPVPRRTNWIRPSRGEAETWPAAQRDQTKLTIIPSWVPASTNDGCGARREG